MFGQEVLVSKLVNITIRNHTREEGGAHLRISF